jgi:hypothetical protein
MYSTCYSCQILTAFEVSQQIKKNGSDTKFDENPSRGSRVFSMLADRHDEANNSSFPQFCDSA